MYTYVLLFFNRWRWMGSVELVVGGWGRIVRSSIPLRPHIGGRDVRSSSSPSPSPSLLLTTALLLWSFASQHHRPIHATTSTSPHLLLIGYSRESLVLLSYKYPYCPWQIIQSPYELGPFPIRDCIVSYSLLVYVHHFIFSFTFLYYFYC